MSIKITTHEYHHGGFTACINGAPLIGDKGGYSRFQSRKCARKEAQRRFDLMTEDEKAEVIAQGERIAKYRGQS